MMTPMQPMANLNGVSRTQDLKKRMMQGLFFCPLTWNPFMYMSVPVPGIQNLKYIEN